MLVNGIDISTFGITTYNRDIQAAEVVTYDDWLRNAAYPTFIGQKEYFKDINVTFFFRGNTEQIVTENISNFIKLLEKCTIQFDKLDFYYDCTIVTSKIKRYAPGTQQQLEVTLKSSYSYKDYISIQASNVNSVTINNPGNLSAMAVVNITPSTNLGSTIIGSFSINNLAVGQSIIVDGEQILVTQNGANKYGDFAGDFLMLQPGCNTILISNTSCNINIKFKPKWI